MGVSRSLGGIGKLYQGEQFLGEVYYNIPLQQSLGPIVCNVVFVGNDLELPHDQGRYRLYLEDSRYLIIMLRIARIAPHAPYSCTSCDGIWHTELSLAYS